MNSSLDHLPQNKRADLKRIVALVRDVIGLDVEMIILYGSYARGDWKEEKDLPPRDERKSGHASDYDILILTRTPGAAESVELRTHLDRKAPRLGLSARPRFIAYDIASFNERLADGRFFYTDIKAEGRMLYDTQQFALEEAKTLSPEERHRIAKEYFEHNFKRASMFFETFEHHLKKGQEDRDFFKLAAFDLHQCAEASLKTVLLVFTGYSPDEHWLGMLISQAAQHDPELLNILPQTTDEEERLFKLLDYAYIGARYDAKYEITKEELDYLAERVRRLQSITEEVCTEHIAGLDPSGDSGAE